VPNWNAALPKAATCGEEFDEPDVGLVARSIRKISADAYAACCKRLRHRRCMQRSEPLDGLDHSQRFDARERSHALCHALPQLNEERLCGRCRRSAFDPKLSMQTERPLPKARMFGSIV
jgi:hypothetical protein